MTYGYGNNALAGLYGQQQLGYGGLGGYGSQAGFGGYGGYGGLAGGYGSLGSAFNTGETLAGFATNLLMPTQAADSRSLAQYLSNPYADPFIRAAGGLLGQDPTAAYGGGQYGGDTALGSLLKSYNTSLAQNYGINAGLAGANAFTSIFGGGAGLAPGYPTGLLGGGGISPGYPTGLLGGGYGGLGGGFGASAYQPTSFGGYGSTGGFGQAGYGNPSNTINTLLMLRSQLEPESPQALAINARLQALGYGGQSSSQSSSSGFSQFLPFLLLAAVAKIIQQRGGSSGNTQTEYI